MVFFWSGRWDLNPRQLAWEARTLPLSYARPLRKEELNPTLETTRSQGNYRLTPCTPPRQTFADRLANEALGPQPAGPRHWHRSASVR